MTPKVSLLFTFHLLLLQEEHQPEPAPAPAINQPPPDANMVLKYTYGVNAWKHWVVNKNQQLQQGASPGAKSR